jgi:hypothetical protein
MADSQVAMNGRPVPTGVRAVLLEDMFSRVSGTRRCHDASSSNGGRWRGGVSCTHTWRCGSATCGGGDGSAWHSASQRHSAREREQGWDPHLRLTHLCRHHHHLLGDACIPLRHAAAVVVLTERERGDLIALSRSGRHSRMESRPSREWHIHLLQCLCPGGVLLVPPVLHCRMGLRRASNSLSLCCSLAAASLQVAVRRTLLLLQCQRHLEGHRSGLTSCTVVPVMANHEASIPPRRSFKKIMSLRRDPPTSLISNRSEPQIEIPRHIINQQSVAVSN